MILNILRQREFLHRCDSSIFILFHVYLFFIFYFLTGVDYRPKLLIKMMISNMRNWVSLLKSFCFLDFIGCLTLPPTCRMPSLPTPHLGSFVEICWMILLLCLIITLHCIISSTSEITNLSCGLRFRVCMHSAQLYWNMTMKVNR